MPDKKELQKEIKSAWNMKPEKAIAFFKQKQPKSGSHWDWTDTLREQHDRVFVVAKATSLELVKDIKNAIQHSLEKGTSFQDFENELIPTLKQRGWWGDIKAVNPETNKTKNITVDHRRLRNIYSTNMRTAYDAGKYEQMMEEADVAPYWRYVAIPKGPLNRNPRQEHAALHNMVLRYDDPFWQVFFGHKGWNCHCTVKNYTKRSLERKFGKKAEDVVQKSDPKRFVSKTEVIQGKTVTTQGYKVGSREVYPDAGWDYAPGAYRLRYQNHLLKNIEDIQNTEAKAKVSEQFSNKLKESFKKMVEVDAPTHRTDTKRRSYTGIGIIPNAIFDACKRLFNNNLESKLFTFDQFRISHTLRDTHDGIDRNTLAEVPWLIEEYIPTYRRENTADNGLVFFSLPFRVGEKLKRHKIAFNYDEYSKTMTYKTGLIVDANDIEWHEQIRR